MLYFTQGKVTNKKFVNTDLVFGISGVLMLFCVFNHGNQFCLFICIDLPCLLYKILGFAEEFSSLSFSFVIMFVFISFSPSSIDMLVCCVSYSKLSHPGSMAPFLKFIFNIMENPTVSFCLVDNSLGFDDEIVIVGNRTLNS